ncbi:MAG: hypothetical protein AAF984_09635 [Verrucomicrobiota bacterium]
MKDKTEAAKILLKQGWTFEEVQGVLGETIIKKEVVPFPFPSIPTPTQPVNPWNVPKLPWSGPIPPMTPAPWAAPMLAIANDVNGNSFSINWSNPDDKNQETASKFSHPSDDDWNKGWR